MAAGKQAEITLDTNLRWQYAIRCYAAIDDVEFLFREFISDPTPKMIRAAYMNSLRQWLALGRENDYLLLGVVSKSYRNKTTSHNIMHLFHYISVEDAAKPETIEHLVEGLNNDLMPIRTLSYSHLLGLMPKEAWSIPYDPADPPQFRQKAVRAWVTLLMKKANPKDK
jgi:hypothetical protein